jgi:hypothetical protein
VPESPHRSPLTLEDLLRLKRAERPSPEFWSHFEVELRQKQLAALIERRPWWQSLSRNFTGLRMLMPVGATAILVFTLVSVSYYSPARVTHVEPVNSSQAVTPVQLTSVSVAPAEPNASVSMITLATDMAPALERETVVVATVPLSEQLPEHAAELTPWSASRPVQSPSAQLFAVADVQSARTELHLTQALSPAPVQVAHVKVQRSGGAVAELASVSAMSSKRSRLLAQFNERQFSPEPQAPAVVRERLTRRLASADTSYNDHITRVGLKGDQVSLRF